jgi:hypothetical protein
MIAATVKPAIEALDQAIKAEDVAQFAAAYGQLTTSCNVCHRSAAEHAMIVIQVPTASSYPDQDFSPPKP